MGDPTDVKPVTSEPSVSVVNDQGQPVPSVAGNAPFWVELRLPAKPAGGGDEARVTLKTSKGTRTLTLVHDGGVIAPFTYRSREIVLDKGAVGNGQVQVGGLAWNTGGMSSLGVAEDDALTVTYSTGNTAVASTHVDAYPTALDQAWHQTSDWLEIEDKFWREVAMGVKDMPSDDPQVAVVQRESKVALSCIERARAWLNDGSQLVGTQVAMASYWMGPLSGGLDIDIRTFGSATNQYRENVVKWSNWDTTTKGLAAAAVASYQLLIGLTPSGQLWTIFTGTNIIGNSVGWSDRIVAVLELAGQGALDVAFVKFHLDHTVGSTTLRARIARRNLNNKEPFKGIAEGTRVRAEDYGDGSRRPRGRQTRSPTKRTCSSGSGRRTRPRSPVRAIGNPGKPMAIKPKTINDFDVMLGADPEGASHGYVGYFKPVLPERPAGMNDATWTRLQARFNERMTEYTDTADKMDHLIHDGQIRIEKGVIVDTGVAGNTGKPITGDYDLWRITDRQGNTLPPEQLERVVNKLPRHPSTHNTARIPTG